MASGPPLAKETEAMPGAVYSPFADRQTEGDGPIYPLHVGDTWREPFVGARSEDIHSADHPRLHAYGDTRGLPELVTRVCQKLRERNGLTHEPEEILITAGATGGLAALAGATLSPGDEILILAPFWPLIRGIAQSFRAKPVEVPFYERVDTLAEAVAAVASHGVNFINEDEARSAFARLLKHIAHATGAHAHKHLHKIRAANVVETRIGLARNGFC